MFSYFLVMNLTKLQLIYSADVFQAPITAFTNNAGRKANDGKNNHFQIETLPLLTRNVRMDRSLLIYIQQQNVLVLLLCCALEIDDTYTKK